MTELVLDDWQEKAVQFMISRKRCGLGAEMGLGKTPATLEAMKRLEPKSVIIIVTKRAMLGWLRMMKEWYPEYYDKFVVILKRDTEERKRKWASKPDFVITTFNWFQRDQKYIQRRAYDLVIYDEAHKFLRGRKTKTFTLAQDLHSLYLFIVTGSPASRGPEQFWTYFNLINSKVYSSYWRFVNTFCTVLDGPFGKEVVGVKNVDAFQALLRQSFLVVRKSDLGPVKKRRLFLDAQMTAPQAAAYKSVKEDMILHTADEVIVAASPMVACLRLRQILCCPAMLDPALGIGGALTAILEELKELPREDRHCTIFTPFRDALPIIADQLVAWNLDRKVFLFQGGLEVDELGRRLEEWRQSRGIAVCTIKYAESFDMETTDKGFMLGYEWDPYENYQAEDRIDRRNNSHSMVRIFYSRILGSYDEQVMEALVFKATNLNAMYNDPKKLKSLLGLKSQAVEVLGADD